MSSGKKGYVLLEIMLAAAIFSIAVVGFARTVNAMLEAIIEARTEKRIQLNLENLTARTRASTLTPGSEVLQKDGAGLNYVRDVSVLELRNSNNVVLPHMFKVVLRVSAQADKEGESDPKAEFYVYQPPGQ
jgi:hypothetical protein